MPTGLQTAAHGYSQTTLTKTETPATINRKKIRVAFNIDVCDMELNGVQYLK